MSILRRIEQSDGTTPAPADEGTTRVTHALPTPMVPTEEAEMLAAEEAVEATFAEIDGRGVAAIELPHAEPGLGGTPWALGAVLARPVRTLASVTPTAWRIPVAVLGAVVALRTALYVGFSAAGGNDAGSTAFGAASSLLSPALWVAAVTGILLATSPVLRERGSRTRALAMAALAAAPIAMRSLVQALAMPFAGHALNPTGLVGLYLPDAPPAVLWALAPLDIFGVWALALAGIALYVALTARPVEQLDEETDGCATPPTLGIAPALESE